MPSDLHFAQLLDRLLKTSPRVLLTITTQPDGDSIGSMLAMHHVVKQYGHEAFLYSPDPIPAMFEYLTGGHRIMAEMPDRVHDYPLVIIFDTGDMKRTPLADELIKRDSLITRVINIDHHPTVTEHRGQSAVDHSFVDVSASSNTMIMFRLLRNLGVPLTSPVATALLTGILTDTGHFAYLNTTQEAMEMAAELMRFGADHRTITSATMRNKSIGTLQLWGRALSRLNLNRATGVVSTVLTLQDFHDCGVDSRSATGISNFLNSLSDGKVAMVLKEEAGGFIKGSLRTTSRDTNVADVAKQFGGGGHAKAAGFRIRGKITKTSGGWKVVDSTPDRG